MASSVIITIAVFLVVIIIDIILLAHKNKYTYSQVIRKANTRWAMVGHMIVFGMGLLAGHWFW